MTKGERLIWELFMKLREVLPATPDLSKWATEWAAVFREMEHSAPEAKAVEPEHLPQPSADDHDDDDGGDDDVPHVRAAPKRKKR
jgi:hypothetical protein